MPVYSTLLIFRIVIAWKFGHRNSATKHALDGTADETGVSLAVSLRGLVHALVLDALKIHADTYEFIRV